MENDIDTIIDAGDKLVKHSMEWFEYLSGPKRETEEFLYKIIKENGTISDADFEKAALLLNVRKLHKRLKNYYKILEKSNKIVNKISQNSGQPLKNSQPTEDWIEYFEDLASRVSDDSIQEIWARLLVQEQFNAGGVSKVMLNTFALLDGTSALAFSKLCKLTFELKSDEDPTRFIPLVLYDDILHQIINKYEGRRDYKKIITPFEEFQEFLPTQQEIEYLSELNLIKLSVAHDESEIYSHRKSNFIFSVGNKSFSTNSIHDTESDYYFICTGQAFFTQTGLALYHALAEAPYRHLYKVLKGYVENTENNWNDMQNE